MERSIEQNLLDQKTDMSPKLKQGQGNQCQTPGFQFEELTG